MQKGIDKIKRKWEEEPLQVIVIATFAVTALTKLIDVTSQASSRRAYAKQIDYRVKRRL